MIARIESLLVVLKRLVQTRIYRGLLAWLSPDLLAMERPEAPSTKQFTNAGIPAEIVVYFPDAPMRVYQVDQWLPVLDRLHERHPVLVVTRNLGAFRRLEDCTRLPMVYARRLRDLEYVLEAADPKICLYVNNSVHNFQALSWRRALHVHLNHGESDKISMASNQAKAYDAVLVAGEAAELRYTENILAFDGANLVRIGRPQLDLDFAGGLPASTRPTVMYAPTWEGDTPAMDYTSLPRFGPSLVRSLLADGRCRVVYKPHPRVETGSATAARAHREIVRMLSSANTGLAAPDRHVVEMEAPIIGLFGSCDAVVCDVSSVALDWLYLRTEAPLWICDPYDDRERLARVSPAVAGAHVLDGGSADSAGAAILAGLEDDTQQAAREEARRFYFGDTAPGESMKRFLDAIDEVIARRDALLEAKSGAVGLEIAAGVA